MSKHKHETEISYQTSVTELEMLQKITQEKLQFAEKKKIDLQREITKKEEQVKFEVDGRAKDKNFYDRMKEKLEKEIHELTDELEANRRESNKNISQLTIERNQLKKDLQIEENNSEQKINELYR